MLAMWHEQHLSNSPFCELDLVSTEQLLFSHSEICHIHAQPQFHQADICSIPVTRVLHDAKDINKQILKTTQFDLLLSNFGTESSLGAVNTKSSVGPITNGIVTGQ